MGLEPIRSESHAPQTCASASSATSAYKEPNDSYFMSLTEHWYYTTLFTFCQGFFSIFLSFVAFYKLAKIFGASLGKMHTVERRSDDIYKTLYVKNRHKMGASRYQTAVRPTLPKRCDVYLNYRKITQGTACRRALLPFPQAFP